MFVWCMCTTYNLIVVDSRRLSLRLESEPEVERNNTTKRNETVNRNQA